MSKMTAPSGQDRRAMPGIFPPTWSPISKGSNVAYPGYPFLDIDPLMKLNIWNKGIVIEGYDPAIYRQDICGSWMKFDEHAMETDYGWEIDHILPRSMRGMSYIANLQPLWWRNNRLKGDTYPWVLSRGT